MTGDGLRIDIEPSIGNNDEDFCAKWFARLNEFSLTLMEDIISYSEDMETKMAERITKETPQLKDGMDAKDLNKVMTIMDNNAAQRRKRFSTQKKKICYHLRYNWEPNHPKRRPDRWEQLKYNNRQRNDNKDKCDRDT